MIKFMLSHHWIKLLLISVMVTFAGCRMDRIENLERIKDDFYTLYSSKERMEASKLEAITLSISNKNMKFNRSGPGHSLEILRIVMHDGLLPSFNDITAAHGQYEWMLNGQILVDSSFGKTTLKLLRSKSEPRLFAVEHYKTRGPGSSLTYFIDSRRQLSELY